MSYSTNSCMRSDSALCFQRCPQVLSNCCSAAMETNKSISDFSWQSSLSASSNQTEIEPSACNEMCNLTPSCCGDITSPCCISCDQTPTSVCVAEKFIKSPANPQNTQYYEYAANPLENLNTHYEYQEPEENFISIDDAKIKSFLAKIGQEQAKSKKKDDVCVNEKVNSKKFQIIELSDENERERLKQLKNMAESNAISKANHFTNNTHRNREVQKTQSPHISLIPRTVKDLEVSRAPHERAEKIVASIDLVDSSSDSELEDTDDDTLPLAVTAVSCELQSDDDDYSRNPHFNSVINDNEVMNVTSNDSISDNEGFLDDPQHSNSESSCKEYTEPRTRGQYECSICQKVVQSNYNLRRHMMIHTGEKPYGCDLCEKRFREYSDLKKHRRRHFNENNFFCMVCKINRPLETDSTRCASCDTKNGAVIAAMYPQSENSLQQEKSSSFIKPTMPSLRRSSSPISSNNNNNNNSKIQNENKFHESNSPVPLPPPPPLTPIANITADSKRSRDGLPTLQRIDYASQSYSNSVSGSRNQFQCPLCHRSFGTRHNLKRHFMIHTGEKPFSCTSCRKPFREYSTLKKHMATHLRDKWYKCFHCPLKFRDYLEYQDHKNTHPFEEDDDEYIECYECGQKYANIEAYTDHLKEHNPNIAIYECYICKKNFSSAAILNQHMHTMHSNSTSEINNTKDQDTNNNNNNNNIHDDDSDDDVIFLSDSS